MSPWSKLALALGLSLSIALPPPALQPPAWGAEPPCLDQARHLLARAARAAVPPLPAKLPELDSIVYKGYRIRRGQSFAWNGRRITVADWFQDEGQALMIIPRGTGKNNKIAADALIDLPDLKASYDPALAAEPLPQRIGRDAVGVDRYADEAYGGWIYRTRLPEKLPPNNIVEIIELAPDFCAELGFRWDPAHRVITHPDPESLAARLKKLYSRWGLEGGLVPKEVHGIIPDVEYASVIGREKGFPVSDRSNMDIFYHDVLDHAVGFVGIGEAGAVASDRIEFLLALDEKLTAELDTLPKAARQRAGELRDKVRILRQRETMMMETGSARVRYELLDGARNGTSKLRGTLRSFGSVSARDLKDSILAAVSGKVRDLVDSIPAASRKVTDFEGLEARIYRRFGISKP